MKLKNRYNDNSYGDIFKEMFCELTYKLDELYKIDKDNRLYSHKRYYIVADDFCRENRCLAIRVPGKTVGCIRIDEDNKIVSKNKGPLDVNAIDYFKSMLFNKNFHIKDILEIYLADYIAKHENELNNI